MKKDETIKIIESLKKEIEEWRGKYLRALADYQNLEKRVSSEKSQESFIASKNLIIKLLSVVDVLEKAEKMLNDQGLSLAMKQFRDLLTGERVEKIEVLGKKFDPILMECIDVVASGKDGEVLEEVRPGYIMFNNVIRPSQVKVGKKVN